MRLLVCCLLFGACSTPDSSALDDVEVYTPVDDDTSAPAGPTIPLDGNVVAYTPEGLVLSVFDPQSEQVLARYQLDGRAGAPPVVTSNRVYVTLRDDRAIAVLKPTADGLQEQLRVEVGPEPTGLIVDEQAGRAWVAVSMQSRVVEVDLRAAAVIRTWDVAERPRWLTRLPTGVVLVASDVGERLYRIDPDQDVAEAVALPTRFREDGTRYTMRVTGQPAIDEASDSLWIPAVYVDPLTPAPVEDPDATDDRPNDGYVDRSQSLSLTSTRRFMYTLIRGTADAGLSDDSETHVFLSQYGMQPIRGLLTGVYADPQSDLVLVSLEGSKVVLATRPRKAPFPSNISEFVVDSGTPMRAPDGVRELWSVDGEVWGYGFIDRALVNYDLEFLRSRIAESPDAGSVLTAKSQHVIAPSILGRKLEEGRMLFYSSIDRRMVFPGGGLSCATCHVYGSTDGLTWALDEGPRQTPSLAGPKTQTEPVTWTRSVPSVADEILQTSRTRMGGEAPSRASADLAAQFIDSIPYPDVRPTNADDEAIARGKEIFEGSAFCSSCHRGANLTDRNEYEMLGEIAVRTPTLRSIAATAPYFHDGSAATIADVIDRAEDEGMGRTNHLSAGQKADLVAYVASL